MVVSKNSLKIDSAKVAKKRAFVGRAETSLSGVFGVAWLYDSLENKDDNKGGKNGRM